MNSDNRLGFGVGIGAVICVCAFGWAVDHFPVEGKSLPEAVGAIFALIVIGGAFIVCCIVGTHSGDDEQPKT